MINQICANCGYYNRINKFGTCTVCGYHDKKFKAQNHSPRSGLDTEPELRDCSSGSGDNLGEKILFPVGHAKVDKFKEGVLFTIDVKEAVKNVIEEIVLCNVDCDVIEIIKKHFGSSLI